MRDRILFLDQFGTMGGGQQVLLDTLSVLDPDQFEVVAALNGDGAFRALLQSNGTRVIDLPLGNYHSRRKTIRDVARFGERTLRCSLQLASVITRDGFDLVFANGPRTFACGTLAGRLTGRPVIWHLHNVLSVEMTRSVVFMTPWVRQIIACSKAAAEPLLKHRSNLQSKIRVIHNPVPDWPDAERKVGPDKSSFGSEEGVVSFGVLGRVTPLKGQAQFLQAAQLVLHRSDKVRFFIVGSPAPDDPEDQAYYRSLRTQVANSRIASHVHFIDHVTDVQQCYSLLDVVVLASQDKEASPRTMVESLYLGKPVIAPCQGGISEVLRDGETGLLVPKADPSLLAEKMVELVYDGTKRLTLGAAAKKDVIARFPRGTFRKQVNKALAQCLEKQFNLAAQQVSPLPFVER